MSTAPLRRRCWLASCATPGSKHWWIEALDADRPEDLPTGRRTVVLPGDARVAVKDPVITVRDGRWEMWLCEHPLTEPGQEDRMSTSYLTSGDGHDILVGAVPETHEPRLQEQRPFPVAQPEVAQQDLPQRVDDGGQAGTCDVLGREVYAQHDPSPW